MGAHRPWWSYGPVSWVRSYLRRMREAARADHEEKVSTDTHPRMANVTTSVRRMLDAPASQVWALLPDAAHGPDALPTFVVPGTPENEVGELRCVVKRRPDGALIGAVHELLAIETGHTRVYRERQEHQDLVTTTTVQPLSESTCEVAVWFTFQTSRKAADRMRVRMEVVPTLQIDLIAERLEDGPVSPSELQPLDVSRLKGGELMVSVVIPAPAWQVWDAVRPAEQARLDVDAPDAVTFTVPGTPRGEVGERICIVAAWNPPGRDIAILEVTAQDPGRSFTVRSLSTAHMLTRTVVLKSVAGGTEVTMLVRMLEDERRLARQLADCRTSTEAYLARLHAAAAPGTR